LNLDPDSSLRGSIARFATRFAHMERSAGGPLAGRSAEALDLLWRKAKAAEDAASDLSRPT
jgi:hypothetical protein